MKKTFISLFLLTLIVSLLSSAPVMAETIISFAIPNNGWYWGDQTDDCAGNFNQKNVVNQGAFVWSGGYYEAVQRYDDTWTGASSGSKCCTRNTVPFSASTYTITLITQRRSDNVTMTLPTITIQQGTPSTHYAATAKWDKDGVLQTEDVSSSHQFYYADASDKKSRDKEVTLTYNNVVINSAGSYKISIEFPNGDKDKYLMKTLTITQDGPAAPTYEVSATAPNGTVSGTGSFTEGATVTLTPNPNPYYAFSSWSGLTGVSVDGYEDDNPLTFTMPAGAVSVTANFVSSPCTDTKTIQCEDYFEYSTKPSGSNDNKPSELVREDHIGHGTPEGGYYADFKQSTGEMWIPITLPAGTFTFTVRYVKGGDNMWFNLYDVANSSKIDNSKKLANKGDSWDTDESNSYTLSGGDYVIGIYCNAQYTGLDQITITATSNVFCNYTITMEDGVNGGNPTSDVASAAEGATVTVTAGEPESGYYFSGWSASPTVTFSDASVSPATFSMPASDVTITANYAALVSSTFTYTTSGSGSITCATESGSSVVSGTAIPMTAVPSTDYVFTGWTATAGSFSDEYALTTTFTMPASAATVTANFAQVDNVITVGSESGSSANNAGGGASITESNISDFDAFAHNVIKLAYSNMSGSDNWYGWNLGRQDSYNPANSAGATGFGFYYKTETDADKVAFCFDYGSQYKVELPATNNVWKYHYFGQSAANGWNGSNIIIYINGTDGGNTTAIANGAIYLADIAATSITSKPEIANYHYTNNRGGLMAVNDYGTLCLPMAGTISGATLYSVAGKETGGDISYLVLEDQGTNVVAGKPYITQSTATSYTVTMSGVHSDVQSGNGLMGTYTEENLTPYDDTHHNYFLYANAFKKAGTGVTVGAYRAYLDWDAVSAPAQAPSARRIRMVIEGTNSATGLEDLINDQLPVTSKVLIDGQLFIIREGKRYTLTGARAQ